MSEPTQPGKQTPAVQHWRANAEAWIAWARSPQPDTYWFWRDAFFNDIVPTPGRLTVEVGCGEGRVTRDLLARGHRVIAVEIVDQLVFAAKALDSTPRYVLGDAEHLPFQSETFDTAVTHNVLMDVDELETTVAEISRVLALGGTLCASVVHPMFDSGAFDAGIGRFVLNSSYQMRRPFNALYRRGEIEMPFRGWSYSMEHYFRALEAASLVVERLREPMPVITPGPLQSGQHFDIVPPFLHFRARRVRARSA